MTEHQVIDRFVRGVIIAAVLLFSVLMLAVVSAIAYRVTGVSPWRP